MAAMPSTPSIRLKAMQLVPDEVVDAVDILPADTFAVRGQAHQGDDSVRGILEAFVTVDHDDGEFLLEGARRGESRATDGGAFAFPAVSGHEGVVIEVGVNRAILMSEAAFGRLMDRLRLALKAAKPGGAPPS